MSKPLEAKVAVVTGASSGIGEAIARVLIPVSFGFF
jgi:NADP-dependent 3-hydroxy acid dehydrogenase YdfG